MVVLENFINKTINDDCLSVLPDIPDSSIDLVITSPPYFVNKSYEENWSLQYYLDLMNSVFKQISRVLKPGKYFVVNFGDYFDNGRIIKTEIPSVYPASINYFHWGRINNLDLQATRIWRKNFSRMSIPFVCNSHPRPVFDYEHIWTFRKPNGTNKETVNDRKKSQRGVWGDSWNSPAFLSKHDAAFPIELPEWSIDVYSDNTDDIILDPFAGKGTTLLAAKRKGRNFIGIEKDYDNYQKIINELNNSTLIKIGNKKIKINRI